MTPSRSFNPRVRPLLWTVVAVLLGCLLVDQHLTRKYGGGDLRDKVVGSRSLLEGRSPYFEPWRPGDPERFADPMVPQGSELTRFTGSPFQAFIMSPMGMIPFTDMRLAWLLFQYALLLFSVGMMVKWFGLQHRYAGIIAVAFLVVLVGSSSWRLHVERGQIYVIYAVIIATLFMAVRARKDVLVGVLGAVMVLFKPTFGLLLLPLVLVITPRMILGGVATIILAMVPFLFLPDGFNSWTEYSAAMQVWGDNPGRGAIPPVVPMDFNYPDYIEGVHHLAAHHGMEAENGSITAILHRYDLFVPAIAPFAATMLLMAVVAIWGWRKWKYAEATDLLLLGFCFNTILMMLLPTLRFHYQFVMWTAPLLYLLFTYRTAPIGWHITMILAGALIIGALDLLPVNVLFAELALLCLIGYYIHDRMTNSRKPTAVHHTHVVQETVVKAVP